jgi:hypothetical protein
MGPFRGYITRPTELSLVESLAVGSQLGHLGSCSEIGDRQRECEAANMEVEISTAWNPLPGDNR